VILAVHCLLLQVNSSRFQSSNFEYTNCIDLPDPVRPDSTSYEIHHELVDSGVTDLDDDVMSGTTDDDWCSSDKENSAVFPFHDTASVIAMEHVFAKQRLPNFIRPKGYISPLLCPKSSRSRPVPSHVSLHKN